MNTYMSASFWAGVCERCIKTAAQTALALVTVGTAITDLDARSILAVTATAVLASLLTSLADPHRTDTATATYEGKHKEGNA
jgi:hypothetical protein